jgi:glycosyltransferase involved in cell wall biosynthesis
MKILIISTMQGFSWGGSEELWYTTARHALDEGCEVEVVVMKNKPLHQKLLALADKICVTFIGEREVVLPSLLKRVLCKFTGSQLKITERDRFTFLYERHYDLLLLSQGGAVDIAHIPDLSRFLKHTQLPYVILNHLVSDSMLLNDNQRKLLQPLFAKAKKICFVSKQNCLEFQRKIMIPMTDSIVVKNPVNLTDWAVQPWPKTEAVSMAIVARLDVHHKGHDLLLAVLQQPQWEGRIYKLHIYGIGPHEAYLKELIQFYRLENKVELMGHCSNIKSIWQQNQILLLPSRTEGLPLTIVEAMLCGRVVVSTNVGDSAILIEDGITGWVAESPTLEHIGAAMERAWQARVNWQQAGAKAYERAKEFVDPAPGKTLFNILQQSLQ